MANPFKHGGDMSAWQQPLHCTALVYLHLRITQSLQACMVANQQHLQTVEGARAGPSQSCR
jgi:hypothetical protein